MAQGLEQLAKGSTTPDNIATIQATVFRTQALQNAIKTKQPQGEKAHTWLSYHEAEQPLAACNHRPSRIKEFEIYSLRDRLAIGLMMAPGLQREEAINNQFTDISSKTNATCSMLPVKVRRAGL